MKTENRESTPLGRELMRALTNKQVEDLLTTIFDLLDEQKLNELRSTVDKDLATTLSRLIATKTPDAKPSSPKRIISDQKYIEEWESLWSEWADIALEVSEEKGQYVCQENDWDPPYFDGYALAEDLDRIAEKMSPHIEKIYKLGAEKENVFLEGLQEIENGIHGLPDWLGADQDSFELGQATTQCILKWEWLVAGAKTQQPATFVERIIAMENASPLAHLHGDSAVEFFKSLPEEARRQIYEYITANRENPQWKERLRTSYSKWHQVYQTLAKSFDT